MLGAFQRYGDECRFQHDAGGYRSFPPRWYLLRPLNKLAYG